MLMKITPSSASSFKRGYIMHSRLSCGSMFLLILIQKALSGTKVPKKA